MRFFACLLLASATLSLPLSAQTPRKTSSSATPKPSATLNMDLAVTDAIRAVLAKQFDEGHIAMLQALGHQQAIAATCPGFRIDPVAFSSEFDLIYDDAAGKPRTIMPADRAELERKATLAMGMSFGAQIAIAANDQSAVCEAAARERASDKVSHLVWAK